MENRELINTSLVLLRDDRLSEAHAFLCNLDERSELFPDANLAWGLYYAKQGELLSAKEKLEQELSFFPANQEARELLSSITSVIETLSKGETPKAKANLDIISEKRKVNLNLDLNSGCNLCCIMCGGRVSPNNQDVLPFEVFRDRVIPVLHHVSDFQMGCQAECLLLPYFEDAARLLGYAKLEVKGGFITNGTALTESKAHAIVESDAFRLIRFSVDAASPALLEYIRKGVKYDALMRNIRRLVEYRNAERSTLQIGLNFTIMRQNIHELVATVQLAKDLGLDMVSTHKLSPDDFQYVDEDYLKVLREENEKAAILAKSIGISFTGQLYQSKEEFEASKQARLDSNHEKKCSFATANVGFVLNPQGNLLFSCQRFNVSVGNLTVSEFDEIIEGDAYKKLLQLFRTPEHAVCSTCWCYA